MSHQGSAETLNAKELVADLRAKNAEAEYVRADVRLEDVRTLIDRTVARFGRLDLAVSNPAPKDIPAL